MRWFLIDGNLFHPTSQVEKHMQIFNRELIERNNVLASKVAVDRLRSI